MPANVIMPALELAQESGKVLHWLKSAGDTVRKGEPLVEIETDKATVEIEAPASGVLREVTAREGDVVPVGRTIALIFGPDEAPPPAMRVSPLASKVAEQPGVDL
ncbi:MAG TPA: biotin/lipoyl-containing protein, partial [Methylomirabilota bacterium]|nr:biotin/lipoyl-containing protein [Methylomirabilota bacterium]